jgi:Uma2 family endonuclease
MAAAATFVTVEEYLRSSFEPDAEYVDGQIEERAVGENDHSAWQDAILAWFRQQAQTGQIRVRPELRVQVAPTSFLVPDVTLLDRNLPIERIATHPPVAVFEILSAADTLKRVMNKCGMYERMGIRTILVIDPAGAVGGAVIRPSRHICPLRPGRNRETPRLTRLRKNQAL